MDNMNISSPAGGPRGAAALVRRTPLFGEEGVNVGGGPDKIIIRDQSKLRKPT